jgi:hypothetical protein
MMEKSAQPGEGVHAHPLSLCLPSRTKLWCTLQREGRFALNEAEGYRGLGQHGGPPGWLEESDPAGVILYVVDGAYHLPFPYRTGALELPKLRADGQTHKEGMACYSSRPMPSLWIYTVYTPSISTLPYTYSVVQAVPPSVCICFSLLPSVFLQISTCQIFSSTLPRLICQNSNCLSALNDHLQSDNQLYTNLPGS